MRYIKLLLLALFAFLSASWSFGQVFTLPLQDNPVGLNHALVDEKLYFKQYTHGTLDQSYQSYTTFRFGLIDNSPAKVDFSLVAETSYTRPAVTFDHINTGGSQFNWDGLGFGPRLFISDPTTDPIGLAFDSKVTVGNDLYRFKNTLIVEKTLGNLDVVYNFYIDTVVDETTAKSRAYGTWGNLFGASYNCGYGFRLGAEAQIVRPYSDWQARTYVSAGPLVSYEQGSFFAAVNPTFRLTSDNRDAKWGVNFIAGWKF